jgi:hypothetical protein
MNKEKIMKITFTLFSIISLIAISSCEFDNSLPPTGGGNNIKYGDTTINNLEPFDLDFPDGYDYDLIDIELNSGQEYVIPNDYNYQGQVYKDIFSDSIDPGIKINDYVFITSKTGGAGRIYLPPNTNIKNYQGSEKIIIRGMLFKKKCEFVYCDITDKSFIVPKGKIFVFIHWYSYYNIDIKRFPGLAMSTVYTILINGIEADKYYYIHSNYFVMNEGSEIKAKPGYKILLNGYLKDCN